MFLCIKSLSFEIPFAGEESTDKISVYILETFIVNLIKISVNVKLFQDFKIGTDNFHTS